MTPEQKLTRRMKRAEAEAEFVYWIALWYFITAFILLSYPGVAPW
jgi:hypothetical protein